MVSKASEDLPDPDSPVITTSRSRGISRSMFLRLCSRAPRMTMRSLAMLPGPRDVETVAEAPPGGRAGAPAEPRPPGAAAGPREPRDGQRGEGGEPDVGPGGGAAGADPLA